MIHINNIEKAIITAFRKTVTDYKKGYIEIEEDFRASMYYNLRPFINKHDSLVMLLSHNVTFESNPIRPDLIIFKDDYYYAAIEFKCFRYSKDSAIKDRGRIKKFVELGISKGFFIHLDDSQSPILPNIRKAEWQNNYYNELSFSSKTGVTTHTSMKRGVFSKKNI